MSKEQFVEAGRNVVAIEKAALEFFEEGYAWSQAEKVIRDTAPEYLEEAWSKQMPMRKSADGCFAWLQHLVWLDRVLEVVPQLPLAAMEVEGLLVYRRVRDKFLREHPPCGACGELNAAGLNLNCRKCGKELM